MSTEQGQPDDVAAGSRWSPSQGQLHGWQPPTGPPLTSPPPPFTPRQQYPPQQPTPQQPTPQHTPQQPGSRQPGSGGRKWGRAGGGAAAGAGAAAKVGLLAKLGVLFKGGVFLLKFKFAGSMILALAVYTWAYGWEFAVGFVALIAVHEFGHILAFRAQGVKASMPTFIPMVGAYTRPQSPVKSSAHMAVASLAGPGAGVLAGIACLEISHPIHSPIFQVLAYVAFFMNLINLIPVWIFDGAKVAKVLNPAVWVAGLVGGVLLEVWHPSRILPFVLILGGFALWQRWRNHAAYDAEYRATPPVVRSWITTGYVTIAVVCLWGMNVAYLKR